MPKPKKSGKKRTGSGRKPGKFPEFPSDVDILVAVMNKNLDYMKNACKKNTFGLYINFFFNF